MSTLKNVFISFVVALALAVAFIGCDNMLKPPAETADSGSRESLSEVNLNYTEDDFSTAFGKAVFLTAKTNSDTISLLKDAGVDVETAGRSAHTELGLYNLGSYITSRSRNIGDVENALEADMAALAEAYNEAVLSLVPSYENALASELKTVKYCYGAKG